MRKEKMVAKIEHALQLPRRPTTAERYLRILKYALGRNRDVETVAKHFGCSTATVINATKAFGLTYDQVRRRRTLPHLKIVEEFVKQGRQLSERDQKVVDLYNSPSVPTLQEIGKEVGLTRQRVHQILKKAEALGIRLAQRRTPPEGHWIERCEVCKRILQLQEEEPLLTRRQIGERLGVPNWIVHWHINKLKARGRLKPHFGYFRSERLIQAIKLYSSDPSLSSWKLGQQLGYRNLPGIFAELTKRGFGYLLKRRRPTSRPEGGKAKVLYAGEGFPKPQQKRAS
jgi:DNA-binding Lrp family transcriptional regulator